MKSFGLHPTLWHFIRTLKDLQEYQENEELTYLTGGLSAAKMSLSDRSKEEALFNLREMFLQSPKTVEDAYKYVRSVSVRMRKYNIGN